MAKTTHKAAYDSGVSHDRLKALKSRMRGSSKGKLFDKKEAPYPTVNEPALVHPWNNAVVKVRDNGNVDVFSNVDNGVRINPNAKTIDMFTGTVKHHVAFIRSFVSRDEMHKVKGFWTIECGTARIYSKGSVDIKAGRDALITAKRNVNVTASGNMKFKSGKDMTFDTGGKFNFK